MRFSAISFAASRQLVDASRATTSRVTYLSMAGIARAVERFGSGESKPSALFPCAAASTQAAGHQPRRRKERPMYPTKNDLSETTRRAMIDLCNARLADAIDLQTQTKQAHWNVKGPHFIALHELFDKVNADVEDY